jgi:hypothetical protein
MKSFLIVVLSAFFLVACKKTVDELPAATQTGANTFGLKLNGEMWVPQRFGVAATAPILEARVSGLGAVFINARNFSSSPTETEFEIYLHHVTGPGTYELNRNTDVYPHQGSSYAYHVKRRFNPLNEWITNSQYTGSVTITKFDTANHIISGTFAFRAGSMDNTASPIDVTDGRFDVKYQ